MRLARLGPLGQNYAWVVAGVTFLALLAAAGLRSAPGVLLTPLHDAFGWERGELSAAAALGIFLYGLVGPFAAALMQTLGLKRTLVAGLVLMSGSTALSLFMAQPWHYVLTWGVLSGLGSGLGGAVAGGEAGERLLEDGFDPLSSRLVHGLLILAGRPTPRA